MDSFTTSLVSIGEEETESDEELATVTSQLASVRLSSQPETILRMHQTQEPCRAFKEAVARGRYEVARPSRLGEPRHKIIHKGMVYITGLDCARAITSWDMKRHDAVELAELAPEQSFGIHAVFVVDHSGSMRKPDVQGFASRTEAVYKCLIDQFVKPQLELMERTPGLLSDAVVSLITMGESPELLIKRHALDNDLCSTLADQSKSRAHHHGHYLPALDLLEKLLTADGDKAFRVMVFWLSDGAESDHITRNCEHGVPVWNESGAFFYNKGRRKQVLRKCEINSNPEICRRNVRKSVQGDCLNKVRRLGDLLGEDKLRFTAVGFGPAEEEFSLLQQMAEQLPECGSFQKLGLEIHKLGLAFTSLTSTLTTMRTSLEGRQLTPNKMKKRGKSTSSEVEIDEQDWDVYVGTDLQRKYRCVPGRRREDVPLQHGATGVAMAKTYFDCGSERQAFACKEVCVRERNGRRVVEAVGYSLVAKEAAHQEQLEDAKFHESMAKTQARAQELAEFFNIRVRRLINADDAASLCISFIPCEIYEVYDDKYDYTNNVAWILAEPFLEGKFTKWNNNGGKVKEGASSSNQLSATLFNGKVIKLGDLPQAFSHFTYSTTNGRQLVCDLQGVWNVHDGFELTDPVIHNDEAKHKQSRPRRTDRGKHGIEQFSRSHTCSALCKELGLKPFN